MMVLEKTELFDWVENICSVYGPAYYLKQVLVIIAISVLGFIIGLNYCNFSSAKGNRDGKNDNTAQSTIRMLLIISLAFPVGLAAFVAIGYVILTAGIPYGPVSVAIAVLIVMVLLVVRGIRKKAFNVPAGWGKITMAFAAVMFLIMAGIAVSGIVRMSVSNDSLYYFWQYPRAIVWFGGLREQFDNFLTDTGLGAAVIGTLPFLFGFGETFGIQEFFHMSFLGFFGTAVFDHVYSRYPEIGKMKSVLTAVIATAVMCVCTPAYVLAHWAMANMYFMEYFLICLYLLRRIGVSDDKRNYIFVGIMMFTAAQLRMEGGIFILFLYALAAMNGCEPRKLIVYDVLPIVLLQSLYELKIFLTYNIETPYTFLTPAKAVIQFAGYIGMIVCLLAIRKLAEKRVFKYLPILTAGVLVLANACLFVIDHNLYIANLRAFWGNLFGQSGWGLLPYLAICAFVMIALWEVIIIRKDKGRFARITDIGESDAAYYAYSLISFVLITLAVSFARGDAMYVNTGDSGNRVLLQCAPLIVVTLVLWFTDLLATEEPKNVKNGDLDERI